LDPDSDAVELFIERATAADATFTPGDRGGSVEAPRRATLDALPEAEGLRSNGAAMDRDQLVAYILERLPPQP